MLIISAEIFIMTLGWAFDYGEKKGMTVAEIFDKFKSFFIKLLVVTNYIIFLAWIAYFLLIYVFL